MATEINIGQNIKKKRERLGLSQEEFAQKSGVKYTTLTKIESSVIKKPSVLIMAKIAKVLDVSIEELIK
jgi:transcriptional regulator with XRE-family HTH domain